MNFVPTASQTAGPFFSFGLTANRRLGILARPGAEGERVRLSFRVLDGDGDPAKGDAMIELWQADAQGRYGHSADPRASSADPNFSGFGRLQTNDLGICVFETVKPGRVPDAEGKLQAPHINVAVFARGLSRHLVTRVYFADETANEEDTVLSLVPAHRRQTLLAHRVDSEPYSWLMEIRLQGASETVFFDV